MAANNPPNPRENYDPTIPAPARTRRASVSQRQRTVGKTSERTAPMTNAPADGPREVAISPGIANAVGMQKYRVGDELGRGGLGAVRAATDAVLLREVAIKWLLASTDAKAREAFIEEAQITGQLEHPNIVPVHELGIDPQGHPYLAMKRIRGRTFREVIAEADREIRWATKAGADAGRKAVTVARAERRLLDIFIKVCDAVGYAHSRGVVHRDLKPANIMVGEFGEVLVVDWGLAKPLRGRQRTVVTDRRQGGAEVTVQGDVFGTPQYMSPRQAMGENAEIDERDDIYALGAILYHMLAGQPPFDGPVMKVLTDVAQGHWRPPSEMAKGRPVPRELEAVVMKAMALDAGARYAEVADLKADIEAYLAGKTLTAADYTSWQLLAKWAARNKGIVLTGGAAAVILLAVVTAFIVWLSAERDRADAEAIAAREAEGRAVAAAEQARQSAQQAAEEAQRATAAQVDADIAATDARNAKAIAEQERDRAQAAQRQTRVQFAEALVAQGDALLIGRRELEAGEKYEQAQGEFAALDISALRADLGLADRYRASPMELMTYRGHDGTVNAVAIAPDGKTAISGGIDQTLKMWDVRTGRILTSLAAHRGGVTAVAYSADGQFAVTAGGDKVAHVFDMQTGRVIATLRGHGEYISRAAFSPDGTRVVTASADTTVRVWDAKTGAQLAQFDTHYRAAIDAKFVPGTNWVVSCGADYFVRLHDISTGAQVRQFAGHITHVMAVDALPNGTHALSGGIDGTLRLWELSTGREVRTILAHRGWVTDVKVSRDGKTAISCSFDGTIRQWDIATGREIRTFRGNTGRVISVSLTADAGMAMAACEDGTLRLWQLPTTRTAHEWQPHKSGIPNTVFSADGRILATCGADNLVKVWDVESGCEIRRFGDEGKGFAAALSLSADGGKLAVSFAEPNSSRIHVYDVRTGAELGRFAERDGHLKASQFLPDGEHVIFAGVDPRIRVWNFAENRIVRMLEGHTHEVKSLEFSADFKRLASCSHDHTVRLWDFASGREIRKFTGHTAAVYDVAFSRDGKFIASGGLDTVARVWSVETGELVTELAGHQTNVRAVAFSPAGDLLLTGSADQSVRLWNLAEAREWRVWADHTAEVADVTFSPDGRWIASGGADGRVVLREADAGRQFQSWRERLPNLIDTLRANAADAAALHALGEWFAFRGAPQFAIDLFLRARQAGADVPALSIARCYWQLGMNAEARAEFVRARAADEAPAAYIEICLGGL